MTNDQVDDPANQRRSDRKAPTNVVGVIDALTGDRIGQIGNLSAEGMMIISQHHIEPGAMFQMEFTLTDLNDQQHHFNVGSVCLWCSAASSRFWAGFEIMDVSEQDAKTLLDIVIHL